jgi:hypothetical protein
LSVPRPSVTTFDFYVGGTSESQREFLDGLSAEDSRRNQDRQRKQPPIANNFALGYTYHDVLDADHEGMELSNKLTSWCSANIEKTYWHASPYTFSPTPRHPSLLFSNPF